MQKVPTYRPSTQLRPSLRFSVLLQEGHFMHRALHSFLNFGRELQSFFSQRRDVRRQLACRSISEAGGGYQSLITVHWHTDHRSTGHRLLTTLYYIPYTMYSVLTTKEILFPLKPKNPVWQPFAEIPTPTPLSIRRGVGGEAKILFIHIPKSLTHFIHL